jgi:hypothetical protein
MDTLFVSIKPFLHQIWSDPEVAVAIVGIISTIWAYLKAPRWLLPVLIRVLNIGAHSVVLTEQFSKSRVMSSDEKLQHAVENITRATQFPKEQKVLKWLGGAEKVVKIILPFFQLIWKKK